jgi:hypothetical protein
MASRDEWKFRADIGGSHNLVRVQSLDIEVGFHWKEVLTKGAEQIDLLGEYVLLTDIYV